MQLRKYFLISRVGEWTKCMCNFTDKFEAVIILYRQIIVSSLVEKMYQYISVTGRAKTLKNFILGKLIYGHLITRSCQVRCWWQMSDIWTWPIAFYSAGPCLNRNAITINNVKVAWTSIGNNTLNVNNFDSVLFQARIAAVNLFAGDHRPGKRSLNSKFRYKRTSPSHIRHNLISILI